MKTERNLRPGHWLGIDIGSARRKLCSFCLITSDGRGDVVVSFEKGPGDDSYPATNRRQELIDLGRPPAYLRPEVEACLHRLLDRSSLTAACPA